MVAKARPSGSRAVRWLRPWWNWRSKRFWLLVVLLVYALSGFLGVPWLIQKQVGDRFAGSARTASIGDLQVNPFTFTVRATEVRVADADGTVLLSFDEFLVNFELTSLFYWAWTFDEVRLRGLSVFEERFSDAPSRYAGLIEALAPPAVAEPEPRMDDSRLPRLIIHDFSLSEGRFMLVDHAAGDFEGEFGPIQIEFDELRTLPDHAGRQSVSIVTPGGGKVEWQGDISFYPLEASGHLSLTDRALNASLHYANHYLPARLSQDGVEITCDYRLRLLPEGLELTVDNLDASLFGSQVVPDDQETPIYSSEEIRLRGGSLRWPEREFSAATLSIRQPLIHLARAADGKLNFEPLKPSPAGAETVENKAPEWSVALGEVRVSDGEISIRDDTVQPALQLALVNWQSGLSGLDNRPGTVMPLRTSLRLSSGGAIEYEGSLTLLPEVGTEGELQVRQVELDAAQPYVNPVLRADIQGGTLEVTARVLSGPGQPLKLAGALGIEGFQVTDRVRDERLVGWRRMQAKQFELNLADADLRTSKLTLEGFYGRLHVAEDRTTNVADLIIQRASDEGREQRTGGEEMVADGTPFTVTVNGIGISDGSLDFSDDSLPIPFEARIASIEGELSTLATNRIEPGELSLSGQVNEYGSARIDGTIDLLAFDQHSDIQMDFRNLEVPRLSPYVAQFAGYLVEDGRLDAGFDYQLKGRKLTGESKLVIRQLKLGKKLDDPSAGSLPLGLAVALLKDANGVIDLDIPLRGDLDNPQFSVSGLFFKVLGNLISKAVTAPFRLLGRLVGADSEDFGRVEFQPGSPEISPPAREKLAKLVEAMAKRPQLKLKVSGVYAPGADARALQEQRVEAAIEAFKTERFESSGDIPADADARALEALFADAFPETPLESVRQEYMVPAGKGEDADPALDRPAYLAALRQRLIEHEEVGGEELLALAEARATAVVEVLAAEPGQTDDAASRIIRGEPVAVAVEPGDKVPLELAVTAEE